MPELEGYVPNQRPGRTDYLDVRGWNRGLVDEVDRPDTVGGVDDDGIWIELDIEPLFKSSDRAPVEIVDLTEE